MPSCSASTYDYLYHISYQLTTLRKFPDIYSKRLVNRGYEPAFDLNAALEVSRQITGRDDEGAYIEHEP